MGKNRDYYVKSKAKMTDDAFKTIHHKNYNFDVSRVFSDDTFHLFKNLRKDHVHLYSRLLNEFLMSKEINSEMEKLIWTSEFLEQLYSNHDKILDS